MLFILRSKYLCRSKTLCLNYKRVDLLLVNSIVNYISNNGYPAVI